MKYSNQTITGWIQQEMSFYSNKTNSNNNNNNNINDYIYYCIHFLQIAKKYKWEIRNDNNKQTNK